MRKDNFDMARRPWISCLHPLLDSQGYLSMEQVTRSHKHTSTPRSVRHHVFVKKQTWPGARLAEGCEEIYGQFWGLTNRLLTICGESDSPIFPTGEEHVYRLTLAPATPQVSRWVCPSASLEVDLPTVVEGASSDPSQLPAPSGKSGFYLKLLKTTYFPIKLDK